MHFSFNCDIIKYNVFWREIMILWELQLDVFSIPQLIELMVRVVVAGLCGAFIGLERTKRLKEAGLRTHCVVAVAAALIMIVSKYGFADLAIDGNVFFAGTKGADPSRMASQVVSGVGFLGAGVIFKNGSVVKGITTAAGIWAVAAIGMAFGSGMYLVGIFTTLFLIVVQVLLHKFRIGNDAFSTNEVTIKMVDSEISRELINGKLLAEATFVTGSKVSRDPDGTRIIQVTLKVSNTFSLDSMTRLMDEYPDIKSISM